LLYYFLILASFYYLSFDLIEKKILDVVKILYQNYDRITSIIKSRAKVRLKDSSSRDYYSKELVEDLIGLPDSILNQYVITIRNEKQKLEDRLNFQRKKISDYEESMKINL